MPDTSPTVIDTPHDSSSDDFEESHEGPIKTPKQLVLTVLASFLVPIVVIIMLAHFVSFGAREGEGSNSMTAEAIARLSALFDTTEAKLDQLMSTT